MSIDLDRIRAEPQIIAAGVVALLLVKMGVLVALGRWQQKMSWRSALKLGGVLWLGGEFAFVVFNQAQQADLLSIRHHDRLVAMVGLSMAATPLLLIAAGRWLDHAPAAAQTRAFDEVDDQQPQVLIAGMGRFGQIVARLLTAQRLPFVALEHSPETVDTLRRFGNARLFYGDPTRPELLRAAGAQHCKVFVVAIDDPDTNIKATRLIRRMYPTAKVLARARATASMPGG